MSLVIVWRPQGKMVSQLVMWWPKASQEMAEQSSCARHMIVKVNSQHTLKLINPHQLGEQDLTVDDVTICHLKPSTEHGTQPIQTSAGNTIDLEIRIQ